MLWRDAEASIETEIEVKILMPQILPYFVLFMTSVHSYYVYMYAVCVYIFGICLHNTYV